MTNAQIKNLIKDFAASRADWEGALAPNSRDLNATYYIATRHAADVREEFDIAIIYDNLVINSEILDADTVSDWTREDMIKMLKRRNSGRSVQTVLKDIENGYFYILNYYPPKGDRVECCLRLKADYNAL